MMDRKYSLFQTHGFCSDGNFIDIGTPQSYAHAEKYFGHIYAAC